MGGGEGRGGRSERGGRKEQEEERGEGGRYGGARVEGEEKGEGGMVRKEVEGNGERVVANYLLHLCMHTHKHTVTLGLPQVQTQPDYSPT